MGMLHTRIEDDCCDKYLDEVISAGKADRLLSWACPACGCEWLPRMVGTIKHWEPHPYVAVFV